MSVEKAPLSETQIANILKTSINLDKESKKEKNRKKIVLLLLYTGMHISILFKKKYNLRVEDNHIIWTRTKKDGKQGHTEIKISKDIEFDVKGFIKELRKKNKRNYRQYYYRLIKDIGERAGIEDLSPMSFRHTFGVMMLNKGFPQSFVQQILNCSDKTLKTYLKYSRERSKDLYNKLDW